MRLVTDAMLDQMRSATEAFMDSTIRIARGDGYWYFDRDTGTETWVDGETVYEGVATIQKSALQTKEMVAGGQDLSVATHIVKAPYTEAAWVLPSDRIKVVASRDPFYTGKRFTVEGVSGNDYGACRRLHTILDLG